MKDLLKALNIEDRNPGACTGREWLEGKGDVLESVSPIDGSVVASVRQIDEAEYDAVVNKSQEAFRTWRMIPAPRRGEIVRQMALRLREFKQPLGRLVTLETGKILAEGEGEVQEMIDIADFAVGLSRQLYGLSMHSERPMHRMYEQWHPLGTVGVITAFNFPVAVWAWNAMIALVCGDCLIWKPSPVTPLCAVAVHGIMEAVLEENDVPEGVINLAMGPVDPIGERLINDRRIPLIRRDRKLQDGGARVGEAVGGRLGRTILELGGNNAIIVMDDADLDMLVRSVLFGAVGTAGQRCTTTRRLIVHRDILDQVTERLVGAYKQVKIGNPLEDGVLMGPLVTEDAVKNFSEAMKTIAEQGGQVLCGGNVLEGCYVEPTIVLAEKPMEIIARETFAPILYVIPFETIDQAVEIHNSVDQGLSSAMFTTGLRPAEIFLSHGGSDCGIANINIGTSGAEIGGAFGGEKQTGGGREAGSDAWKLYMRRQTNTINWSTELPLAQGIKFGD